MSSFDITTSDYTNKTTDKRQAPPSFKFIFYISFMSRKDAVGLDLCEMLVEINKILGVDNFELHVRLSYDENYQRIKNNPRWDEKFIHGALHNVVKEQKQSLKRILVSGPPIMNEGFDKALLKYRKEFNYSEHDFEIM